eukprot:g14961.t1
MGRAAKRKTPDEENVSGAGAYGAEEYRLHKAAETGVIRVATRLLNGGADVNAKDADDRTPLHLACDAGVAGVLIDAGANVTAKDDDGCTPLHSARNAGVAEALIKAGACTEIEDHEGRTPLECATDVEVVRALLDGGANLEHWRIERDELGDYVYGTPLCNSVESEDISLLLIERGAKVNVSYSEQDGGEVSAVWRHVQAGNVRVVREMLRKNVVVDFGDFMEATEQPTDEILRLMIGKVGVSVTNKENGTPLHSVTDYDHAKLLIQFGANVHARDKFGNTPLHTNFVNHEIASLFIEKGADVMAVNHEGETPLHSVCSAVSDRERYTKRRYIWETMFVLAKAGASMEAKRKDGKRAEDLLQIDSGILMSFIKHSDVRVVNNKA